MRYVLNSLALALGFLFFLSPAYALDPLLLEVLWEPPEPVDLPAWYGFNTQIGGHPLHGFPGNIENHPGFVTAYPVQQFTDVQTIEMWNRRPPITQFTAHVTEWVDGNLGPNSQQSAWLIPDDKTDWADGDRVNIFPIQSVGIWTVTPHAPQLGRGLGGYLLTDVEQLIDNAGQNIRFYGIPVPEPSTLLLVVLTHVSTLGLLVRRLRLYRS